MLSQRKSEAGMLTLEACISVLFFLLLMLLLSSLFLMFMAQNATSHALLETSESLSLDVYSIERTTFEGKVPASIGEWLSKFVRDLFGNESNNPSFVTETKWYNEKQPTVAAAVRTRFLGYLSGGDEKAADAYLKSVNVVDGWSGLDFSESRVENDVLYATVSYKLEYDFNIGDLGKVPVEQTACIKLWK